MTTTNRAVRIDDEVWASSLAIAKKNGTTVSAIIRDALNKYVFADMQDSPIVEKLVQHIHQSIPGHTDAQVREAVTNGIACFGIVVQREDANDAEAILNYCSGYLRAA